MNPEVWLRGPLPNIPALLQPSAHALLQAMEEVEVLMAGFPDHLLWQQPAGVASPGFHLRHMAGVLDRLSTYAKAQPLTEQQLAYLSEEGKPAEITAITLVAALKQAIDNFIQLLSTTEEKTLTEFRGVGRKQLPSTVLGLLFHATEHTMRHLGQLIVTVKILRAQPQ